VRLCGWNEQSTRSEIYEWETAPDNKVREYVDQICKLAVIEPNFIIKRANVDNALATIDDDNNRIIYYNPAFFQSLTSEWFKLAILAHEIGHHINSHTFSKNNKRPSDELDADQFAGSILCRMGAPFNDIKQLMIDHCSTQGDEFYPPQSARVSAIAISYETGSCSGNGISAQREKSIKDYN